MHTHTHAESAWCIGASYELTCTGNRMVNQKDDRGFEPCSSHGIVWVKFGDRDGTTRGYNAIKSHKQTWEKVVVQPSKLR